MTMSAGEGARILKHYGLEPWPDGRSICDGKRPVSQHIAMVISSLKAERDAALLQIDELRKGMFNIVGILQGSGTDEAAFNAVYDIAKGFIEKRKCLHPNLMGAPKGDTFECPDCLQTVRR